jgi:SAM-dependent methyltransferase
VDHGRGIELFDEPASWRAEAVRSLGLRGEDRVAATSPGAAFPDLLAVVADHSGLAPGHLLVDVGAGLGGASAWLGRRTGAEVVAVEPAWGSAANACQLFPDLEVAVGTGDDLPLRSGVARAVTLLGVLSLVDEAGPTLAECHRLLAPGGTLGVADLFGVVAPGGVLHPAGSVNTFRSIEAVVAELVGAGFGLVHVEAADAGAETSWQRVGRRVDDEVDRGHGGDPGYADWLADGEALGRRVARGEVEAAAIIGVRRG